MEILETLDIDNCAPASLALGTFDGLHLGHRAVLESALDSEYSPQVFTFKKSPSGDPTLITQEGQGGGTFGHGHRARVFHGLS